MKLYIKAHPDLHMGLERRMSGDLGEETSRVLESIDTSEMASLATRETNRLVMERLWKACDAMCGGGADLANSNKIY